MTTHIIIPARRASTRLPNKPLLPIHGIPMLVWVANRAKQAIKEGVACQYWVACDDEAIRTLCHDFDIPVLMTDKDHPSGTDRLAQAVAMLGLADDDIVINLQGDEPLTPPVLLAQLKQLLISDPACAVATLCEPITDPSHWQTPSVVKVARAGNRALYFSRAAIPYCRDGQAKGYRHLGLYAYRVAWLCRFRNWSVGTLEQMERLEQLRFLENGASIAVDTACVGVSPGVDTAADLARLNARPKQALLDG